MIRDDRPFVVVSARYAADPQFYCVGVRAKQFGTSMARLFRGANLVNNTASETWNVWCIANGVVGHYRVDFAE